MILVCSATFCASGPSPFSVSFFSTASGVFSACARLPTWVRALDDLAIGLDQRVQLLHQRLDLARIVPLEVWQVALADLSEIVAHLPERAEAPAHQKRDADCEEHRKPAQPPDDGIPEAADVENHRVGVAGDEQREGVAGRERDELFERAELAPAARLMVKVREGSAAVGKSLTGRMSKASDGDQSMTRLRHRIAGLPVPAGERPGKASPASALDRILVHLAVHVGVGDQRQQQRFEAAVEIAFDRIGELHDEHRAGDDERERASSGGDQRDAEGEGPSPHAPSDRFARSPEPSVGPIR